MKIWKCDTNWGGTILLDVFVDFRIAFFGTNAKRLGHYKEAGPGDLLGIALGTRIVAIAEIMSRFAPLREIGKDILPRTIIREYAESGAEPVGCKVSNVIWLEDYIVNHRRGRFYELKSHNADYQAVKAAWECSRSRPQETFDVDASRKTLVSRDLKSGLLCESKVRYVVPVYQRPYAWGEREVTRLLDDIEEGVRTREPHFLGSFQVSAPRKLSLSPHVISYELIDGQQRFTTLLILLKCLGHDYTDNLRTVVNAGSAQKDWDDFNDTFGEENANSFPLNQYIGVSRIIREWVDSLPETLPGIAPDDVATYIQEKLIFIVIQTFAGISKTIQLFNVINTAGMDLNASDLFKIRLYEYLTKDSGPDEAAFSKISKCYQKVEDYNRQRVRHAVSMLEAISFFQKTIVSRFKLNSELFKMSSSRFFDRMFDSLLEGKKWPGFSDKDISFSIEDFEIAVDVLIQFDSLKEKNSRLKIMHNFLWETRYGGVASQYPALACYFHKVNSNSVDDIIAITERIFKKLVPPSLMFGRVVNDVYSKLHGLLHAISEPSDEFNKLLSESWNIKGETEETMLNEGLTRDLVEKAPWKRLACKMVEFLLSNGQSDEKTEKLLFGTDYDIEHIQSNKDENNPETIWKDWGWEINGLGNLSMLEFQLNRSIQNKSSKKEDAYRQSHYVSIAKVLPHLENGKWSLPKAQTRHVSLAQMIKSYILSK